MSVQAIAWALKQSVKPAAAKLLLIAIANYADENGKAWPSKQRLARDCSADKSNLCKHMNALRDAGFLTVRERRSQGASLTSVITLNLGGGTDTTVSGHGSTGVVVPVRHKPSSEPSVVKGSSQREDVSYLGRGSSRRNRSSRKGGCSDVDGSLTDIDLDIDLDIEEVV